MVDDNGDDVVMVVMSGMQWSTLNVVDGDDGDGW